MNATAYVEAVREAVKDEEAEVLVIAASIEADIAELESHEEKQLFLEDMGLKESGVNRLIKAAYPLLTCRPSSRQAPRNAAPGLSAKG